MVDTLLCHQRPLYDVLVYIKLSHLPAVFVAAYMQAPALSHRMHAADPVYIICDYVLGIVPLSAAAILHRWSKQQALQVAAKVNGTESGGSAATIALRAMAPAGEPETSSSSSNVESASCSNSSGSNLRDVEVGQKDVDKQQSEQDSKGKNLLFLWRAKFSGSRNG